MRATLRLDPAHRFALPNLAHLLQRRGAAAETVAVYRRLDQLPPEVRERMNPDHDVLCLGLALRDAGQSARARSVMQAAADAMGARAGRTPVDQAEHATRAALLAGAGKTAEARSVLERAERAGKAKGAAAAWFARAYAMPGDADRATALFEQAVETGYDDPYYVPIDPTLALIRERPEVDRLLRPAEP